MALLRYIVAHLHPWLRRPFLFSPNWTKGEHAARVGERGEKIAALWIHAHKGKVLRRNHSAPGGGEVDIVYRDKDTLVFCEVKTRTGEAYGTPALAVNEEKRRLIRKGARYWLGLLDEEVPYRYDIIEVILSERERPRVNRIKRAFLDTE